MRHDVNGTVGLDGERYSYSIIVWSGDDAHRGGEVAAIEPDDMPLDEFVENEELWNDVSEVCLDDASERIRYTLGDDAISDDETVDEYLSRMAKVWHPDELNKMRGLPAMGNPLRVLEAADVEKR